MQFVTINPVYGNKKNPAMPQFVTVTTSINQLSAISISQKKVFEDNLDLKKLESIPGK